MLRHLVCATFSVTVTLKISLLFVCSKSLLFNAFYYICKIV